MLSYQKNLFTGLQLPEWQVYERWGLTVKVIFFPRSVLKAKSGEFYDQTPQSEKPHHPKWKNSSPTKRPKPNPNPQSKQLMNLNWIFIKKSQTERKTSPNIWKNQHRYCSQPSGIAQLTRAGQALESKPLSPGMCTATCTLRCLKSKVPNLHWAFLEIRK